MTAESGCAHAWELMPWVLTGDATGTQREWLDRHLEQCAACRREYEQQNRLRLALRLPAEVEPDVNLGLERLMARLDQPELSGVDLSARPGRWVVRALVAAVLVQALGIGVLGARLWSEPPPTSYRTLSQPSAPVAQGAIHVVPDAGMTVADWDALLHRLGLKVIAGPNDAGAYTVVLADSGASVHDAVRRLRAERGVRLAEPASGQP